MKRLQNICYFSSFVFFALPFGVAFAQPAMRKQGSIDTVTIAAYEDLGAKYVGWVKDSRIHISIGRETGLPGFMFASATNRLAVSKLPQVAVPF